MENIAGIAIPDSKIATEATELAFEATEELVYNHSRRVFLFGSLRGQELNLDVDPELLYVGAMFHDFGLTEKYGRTDQRFEIDAADEASTFLRSHGIDERSVELVWTAIALHTTPEVPLHMHPLIELVTRGVELDVMGVGYDAITDQQRQSIVEAHPRPNFKNGILQAFHGGLKDRPETTFGNVKADVLDYFEPEFVPGNFVTEIQNSKWSE